MFNICKIYRATVFEHFGKIEFEEVALIYYTFMVQARKKQVDCKVLQELALYNKLTIMLVSRKESEESFIGPEFFCGYQASRFNERLKK